MKTTKEWFEEHVDPIISLSVADILARDIEMLEAAAASILFLADKKQGTAWNGALVRAFSVLDDRVAELKKELEAIKGETK